MIKVVQGNLLDAQEDIIAHQVNCFGIAGGLAASIFDKWPDAENDYCQVVGRMCGRESDLLSLCQLTGQQKDGKIIANLFGQFFPGRDFRPRSLELALGQLAAMAKTMGLSVAMPYRISCGICGGDWETVRRIINQTMVEIDVTLYSLDPVEE